MTRQESSSISKDKKIGPKTEKNILYIITNISMPGICKVGITDNLEKRLSHLNKTSSPTRFQVYEKFDDLINVEYMEQEILQHFSKQRLNKKREFLLEHPERICDFILENKKNKLQEEKKTSSTFHKLGIKEGEILIFAEGGGTYKDINAEVRDGGKIFYKNKKTSMSGSALEILNEKYKRGWKGVQGTNYWTYKGKTIRELMDEQNL